MLANRSLLNITLIIPFYNEEAAIQRTLDLIDKLTCAPREILFINSGSTDSSAYKIKMWEDFKQNKDRPTIKILDGGTKLPSSSKNYGITQATQGIIAFIDCGLSFKADWLERAYKKLIFSEKSLVFGKVCYTPSSSIFDTAYSFSVLGEKSLCIPGGVYKKSVFEVVGFFEEIRAGYDRKWIKNAKIFCDWIDPEDCSVEYFNYNFASGYVPIMKKTFLYSLNSARLFSRNFMGMRFFLFPLFIFLSWISGYIGMLYLILRSCYKLLYSSNLSYLFKKPRIIPVMLVVVLSYDFLRFSAGFLALIGFDRLVLDKTNRI